MFITGGPPSVEFRGSKAAEFVLKCLVKIPTKICVALANKVSQVLILCAPPPPKTWAQLFKANDIVS